MLRRVAAQTRLELLLTARRGESVLVAVGIPLGILVFFSLVDVLPIPGDPVDFLVPSTLALAIVSSGMVSLGIATGFERQNGVLRRLGTTPLGRGGLLAAKALSTTAVVAAQTVAIVAVGVALGWRPLDGPVYATHSLDGPVAGVWPLGALAALALGTLTFASIGFALAGALRAETTLAVANGLFLLLLLLGGIVVPVDRLPGALEAVAVALPAHPLAATLRATLGSTTAGWSAGQPALAEGAFETVRFAALGLWAAGAAALAAVTFRWD